MVGSSMIKGTSLLVCIDRSYASTGRDAMCQATDLKWADQGNFAEREAGLSGLVPSKLLEGSPYGSMRSDQYSKQKASEKPGYLRGLDDQMVDRWTRMVRHSEEADTRAKSSSLPPPIRACGVACILCLRPAALQPILSRCVIGGTTGKFDEAWLLRVGSVVIAGRLQRSLLHTQEK